MSEPDRRPKSAPKSPGPAGEQPYKVVPWPAYPMARFNVEFGPPPEFQKSTAGTSNRKGRS